MKAIQILAAGCLMFAATAMSASVPSPDGKLEMRIYEDDGHLTWDLKRGDITLIEPSRMGVTVDGVDLGDGVEVGSAQYRITLDRYPWRGVHSVAVDHHIQGTIPVTHKDTGLIYWVRVRLFDDAAAYRCIVPGRGTVHIDGESATWSLPDDATVWWQPNTVHYEGLFEKQQAGDVEEGTTMAFPITIRYPDGTYAAITEAQVFAYSGMTARAAGDGSIRGVFEDDPEGWDHHGTIYTPWRLVMTGPGLNELVNCDAVHNLCPPPDAALYPDGMQTDWIRPGRALWNWWSNSSLNFDEQKQWVDAAADMGMEFYLVDAGWEKEWNKPDKDKWAHLAELCGYAKDRNVGIHVWKFWGELESPNARNAFFRHVADTGAVGVKIDFMESESRKRIAFYTQTLIDAAEHRLMVNYHGANKPTGEPRTFPNEMTREGIRGLEHNRWSDLPASHYAALPFTRLLAGHGDFTPGAIRPDRLKGTTVTLQLASAIVYTSPLLHWADRWTRYIDHPARPIIEQIPSTWDETIVLPGSQIGDLAAFARRSGRRWFIGVLNGGDARTLPIKLSFLTDGPHKATFVRDAAKPTEVKVEQTEVHAGQTLEAEMARAGGFIAVIE